MKRIDMIKRALDNFSERFDGERMFPTSFYPMDSLGGCNTGTMILQSLMTQEEYDQLAKLIRLRARVQGVLPNWGDWSAGHSDMTLEYLILLIDEVLDCKPAINIPFL